MSKDKKKVSLLDNLSRSEILEMNLTALRCMGFSMIGSLILLTVCIIDLQDVLGLQNPMIKLLMIIGLCCFLIGYSVLLVIKFVHGRGEERKC